MTVHRRTSLSRALALTGALTAAAVGAGTVGVPAFAKAAPRPVRTARSGGPDGDECSLGEVRVPTFVSLRNAPTTDAPELKRLRNGTRVLLCDEAPGWLGVLLPQAGGCFGTPVAKDDTPYRGRCASGWIASRYAKVIAG